MTRETETIQRAYEAFGRGDVPAILALVDDEVDWEFVGSADLPYAGPRRTRKEVGAFFADVSRADEIHAFEPHEFIACGEHVVVLGRERCTAKDTGLAFESDWAHIFTVRNGKIARWRGFFNTAARYGR